MIGINTIVRITITMATISIPGPQTVPPSDPYLVMQNEKQMELEATTGARSPNPYEAVGRFVKAYYYYNLTSLYGDVPLTDALQGALNTTPAYTPQEQVFVYILNELDFRQ